MTLSDKTSLLAVLLLFLIGTGLAVGEEKPTSLSDAQAAIDANLSTPEGKAYDERLGTEFMQKHLGTMRQCKSAASDDLRSFWILLKLDKDGAAKEVLLYPSTKLGTCARETLLKSSFLPPPHPMYWVGVYMKISH